MLYMESLGKRVFFLEKFVLFGVAKWAKLVLFGSLVRYTLAVPKGRNGVRNLLLRVNDQ